MANTATAITELVNDWRLYRKGSDDFVGATSIEIGGLQSATVEIQGIGMAGKINAPAEGHFESIEVTINYRTPIPVGFEFTGGQYVELEAYADIQKWDPSKGEHIHQPLKVTIKGRATNYEMGTIEPMNTSDSSSTIEAHYLKYELDGKEVLEIDKYNYIFKVNGKDYMEPVRKNLQMN